MTYLSSFDIYRSCNSFLHTSHEKRVLRRYDFTSSSALTWKQPRQSEDFSFHTHTAGCFGIWRGFHLQSLKYIFQRRRVISPWWNLHLALFCLLPAVFLSLGNNAGWVWMLCYILFALLGDNLTNCNFLFLFFSISACPANCLSPRLFFRPVVWQLFWAFATNSVTTVLYSPFLS